MLTGRFMDAKANLADWITAGATVATALIALPTAAFFLFDRFMANQSRMVIATKRLSKDILQLDVGFKADRVSEALRTTVTIISPKGLKITASDRIFVNFENSDSPSTKGEPTDSAVARLRVQSDPPWVWAGFRVFSTDGSEVSGIRVMVAVMTWPIARRLYKTTKQTSPMA